MTIRKPTLTRHVLGVLIASAVIGVFAAQPAFADCTRHFVNKTDKPWFVFIKRTNGDLDDITVEAHQTVAYTYASSLGDIQYITFGGPAPENYNQKFELIPQLDQDCVYIAHPDMGNTGSVTVNEPANGDAFFWRAD